MRKKTTIERGMARELSAHQDLSKILFALTAWFTMFAYVAVDLAVKAGHVTFGMTFFCLCSAGSILWWRLNEVKIQGIKDEL